MTRCPHCHGELVLSAPQREAPIHKAAARAADHPKFSVVIQVCQAMGVRVVDVVAGVRQRDVSVARALSMYVLRVDHGLSFSAIGRVLQVDHTTVMYACKRIDRLLAEGHSIATRCLVRVRLPEVRDAAE